MDEKTLIKYREIYQHCCDCQDLAESVGDWSLMSTFEDLRRELNRKMFG
jgi:hypothetical protein